MFLFLTAFICCVNSKVFTEVAGWEKEKHYDRGQFSNDAGIKYHAQNICLKKKTEMRKQHDTKNQLFQENLPSEHPPLPPTHPKPKYMEHPPSHILCAARSVNAGFPFARLSCRVWLLLRFLSEWSFLRPENLIFLDRGYTCACRLASGLSRLTDPQNRHTVLRTRECASVWEELG